ncbi:MAG: zinc-dependent alcohol dehydrogenase family protein [Gammaproteobacteria bacterium]|nr:zinc-dependent alcohol dehydrogenase family protein [Gammaproteobacteria bacterium]
MKAMVLDRPGGRLQLTDLPVPEPGPGEVLVQVHACGVCRTDLHIVDGDITDGRYPVVPGHQIVGTVVAGNGEGGPENGTRVGIPWLGYTCGTCSFCGSGSENLCDSAQFTGYQRPGGFAEYTVADARFCFPLPDSYTDDQAAPLLCAGLIGYRAMNMAGDGQRLGFYGFGNAAHILIQVAIWQGREVYAFTRPGDDAGQSFAKRLGATWAGGSDARPGVELDAAIIFAPVGQLVPLALKAVRRGGSVICAGIHMSDIPQFPYADLWWERSIRSVANLTRRDATELLELAPQIPIRSDVQSYALARTSDALDDLRAGRVSGAAVIVIG